jgi:hypothetical protein
LRQYQAHPAGPGVQQHRVVGLHGIYRLDQQMGGHALEDGCGGDVGGHSIRHRRNDIGWRDTVFGVGADGVGGRDPVTHAQRGHTLTHRGDGAGHFGAEDERQFMRIQPRPEIRVDEIHADRLGFDRHLTGSGGGLRFLDVRKDFRAAGSLDLNRLHGQTFQHSAGCDRSQ